MAKKGQQESQKTKNSKQQKSAADKTFGLKNKNKSSKVQQYVKQVESQVADSAAQKRKAAEAERKAAEKKAAEAAKAEARALFSAAVPQQKVAVGVDPKSVVCAYFKQGLCNKGSRCKFSHDLAVERKGEKRDLYSDERDEKTKDTMDKWDDEKLQQVVLSKHGNPRTKTEKICKYFIGAVESGHYGWFWVCPNGGDQCMYRHSLPPGFKLKTKEEQRLERQAMANAPKITLEEFIETERLKLPKQRTPLTLETFTEWKKNREQKKKQAAEEAAKKTKSQLSGRELMISGKYHADDKDDEEDTWDLTEMRKQAEEEAARAASEVQIQQQQQQPISV